MPQSGASAGLKRIAEQVGQREPGPFSVATSIDREERVGFAARPTAEAGMVHWFALRFGPTAFGVFDTFATEAGRQAHLEGRIAQALVTKGAELFSESPSIERVDVLGVKT